MFSLYVNGIYNNMFNTEGEAQAHAQRYLDARVGNENIEIEIFYDEGN